FCSSGSSGFSGSPFKLPNKLIKDIFSLSLVQQHQSSGPTALVAHFDQRCHPERSEGSAFVLVFAFVLAFVFALAFVLVFALAFLSVIPAGNLLFAATISPATHATPCHETLISTIISLYSVFSSNPPCRIRTP
ncbi:MAG: hypothetical protein WBE36_12650, partial [Terracidiphilus sp.]